MKSLISHSHLLPLLLTMRPATIPSSPCPPTPQTPYHSPTPTGTSHQMRSNPIHMHSHPTHRTRPRPTTMKRPHLDRKAFFTRQTMPPLAAVHWGCRGGLNIPTMFQRPLVDIACVSVHDQVAQRAVVWCGEMEFTVGFEDVGAAWEAEEGIDAGREGDVCGGFVVVCGGAWVWVEGYCSGEVGKAD